MENSKTMHIIGQSLEAELAHGIMVSNLAFRVARELSLDDKICYEMAVAGMLHDIGKLEIAKLISERQKETLTIEELKYVRNHSTLSYTILTERGYSDLILKSILYHHENYDGTGYPANLSGEEIPLGARILRVCDTFSALVSNRLYRSAFDKDTAVELMIDEIKNFDVGVFLAFQRVIHQEDIEDVISITWKDLTGRTIRRNIMPLKKKPVTGMKDIMPREMEIRNYVMQLIRDTYGMFGFSNIETPCVEHIENLSSKQGGENEKLIFKILKRGEKLKLDTAKEEMDLVDGGLRYDLTVPLSRYYSNNANELPSPFKALQMGNVWRADRPQRGRYRQFMQCDIDILGEPHLSGGDRADPGDLYTGGQAF